MKELEHHPFAIPGRVVLAHARPFVLGRLAVNPATRQISADGRSETIEPRVMQVLVALARAEQAIVTRDELIDQCWNGRVVTDDAINRVLSRIRQLASGPGGDSFRVETISRVGYRLLENFHAKSRASPDSASAQVPLRAGATRRNIIAGAGVATVFAGAGLLLWQRQWRHQATPEALALYKQGREVLDQGYFQIFDQAEAWFRQAVEVDPEFADAWGALALTLSTALLRAPESELPHIADEVRSTAHRALELGSTRGEAQAALALIPSWFGRWASVEQGIRGVYQRFPSIWFLGSQLGGLLGDVDRWDDAIRVLRDVISRSSFIPLPRTGLAYAYLCAGRPVEADSESSKTVERWPQHTGSWAARLDLLIELGRYDEANALVAGPRPDGIDPIIRVVAAAIPALKSRESADADRYRAIANSLVAKNIRLAAPAAVKLAGMGRIDDAFELLDAYYFRRGPIARTAAPVGPLTRLDTGMLFFPSMQLFRRDPRFHQLTQAVGLDAYWRSTGFTPPQLRP